MNEEFFNCFDETKGTIGELIARVDVERITSLLKVKMGMVGKVRAICDRCLEEMDLFVEGEMNLYVKLGQREEGNDDDFIVLSQDEDFLDMGPLLYEMYMLNYPIRVVHPEGECNQEMEEVIDRFVVEEKEYIDPRWDELRKLINNN